MSYVIHGTDICVEIPGQLELFPEWYEEQEVIRLKPFWDFINSTKEEATEADETVFTITTVEPKQ